MKKPTLPAPSDGYQSGRAVMPHVMALNKDPGMGMKNNRQPEPGLSNVTAFAKGGPVMKSVGKRPGKSVLKAVRSLPPVAPPPTNGMDMAGSEPPMLPGGMKKGGKAKKKMAKGGKADCYAKGGKVKKMAAGGAARVRKGQTDQKGNPKPALKSANLLGGK